MLAVVQGQAGDAPCVAYFTRQVRLHIGILTWCKREVDASNGVYQVPDTFRVCEACKASIAEFEASR